MLLRSSRVASRLTKQAFLGPAIRGVMSAGKNGAKLVGPKVKTLGGAALTVGPGALDAVNSVKSSKQGLSNAWLSAANAGSVPHTPQF
jgi:hypothetical protein